MAALIPWKLLPTSPTVEASCKLWTTILFAEFKRGKFLLRWGSPHSQHSNGSWGLSPNFFVPRFIALPPPCMFWLLEWKSFLGKFFPHSGKALVDIPSYVGSFSLVSCLSKTLEIMTAISIGHKTFGPSWKLYLRTRGCQIWLCPYRTVVKRLGTTKILHRPPRYKTWTLIILGICLWGHE